MTRTQPAKGMRTTLCVYVCVCVLFHLIEYFAHFATILRLLDGICLVEWYLLHIHGILAQRWRPHWSRLRRASFWRYIRIESILHVPQLLHLQLLCGRLALLA